MAEPPLENRVVRAGEVRRRLLIGAAVVIVASTALVTWVAWQSGDSDAPAQPIAVRHAMPAASADWRLADRGVVTTSARRPEIIIRVLRLSDSPRTPALSGNFDGSGGGEALPIACSAASRPWSIATGRSERITLVCAPRVTNQAMQQLEYVYVDAK